MRFKKRKDNADGWKITLKNKLTGKKGRRIRCHFPSFSQFYSIS